MMNTILVFVYIAGAGATSCAVLRILESCRTGPLVQRVPLILVLIALGMAIIEAMSTRAPMEPFQAVVMAVIGLVAVWRVFALYETSPARWWAAWTERLRRHGSRLEHGR